MVILATEQKEIGSIKDANLTINPNGESKEFSLQIARSNWFEELTFSSMIYVPDTEHGGIIGEMLTDTTLDYVEVKGYTWRGMLGNKVIQPPSGSDYKIVSGELHTVMKLLIEPEFDGLFVVSSDDTGVNVSDYQFDRYCTLLDGITKMLKSVGYKLRISHKRVKGEPNYVLVEAVPAIDYSKHIELSKDCRLNYTMDDKRNGVNHLIVTGKGELQDRNVLHLYVWPDGSFRETQYYTGKDEIAKVYENTSTETDELRTQSEKELKKICNKKTFKMDVASIGIEADIGDVVGGRDYLTGLYSAKPIENIVYSITNDVVSKTYTLEGEDEE